MDGLLGGRYNSWYQTVANGYQLIAVVGWHVNITQYRNKIYDTLVHMHELLPSLHPANRVFVDAYLNGYCMDTIEGILRSTKSVTDCNSQQSQITTLAQFYADAQETALRTNLKEVSYVISSVADATLVAGPARAESVWLMFASFESLPLTHPGI